MYPFRDEHVYVRNAWYVGCLAEEISNTPFERAIMVTPSIAPLGFVCAFRRIRMQPGISPSASIR
jgi:hypothetical protein